MKGRRGESSAMDHVMGVLFADYVSRQAILPMLQRVPHAKRPRVSFNYKYRHGRGIPTEISVTSTIQLNSLVLQGEH